MSFYKSYHFLDNFGECDNKPYDYEYFNLVIFYVDLNVFTFWNFFIYLTIRVIDLMTYLCGYLWDWIELKIHHVVYGNFKNLVENDVVHTN